MHGHRITMVAVYISAFAIATAIVPLLVHATQPDMQFQRRAYRHNENLRMRLKRGGGSEVDHALKARFTPPAVLPVGIVNIPNSSSGDNTPDNM